MPRMQISPKLEPLITKQKRFKVIIGGRGSTKSQGVADIMLMKAQTESAKVGCFREFQNSIDDSVYSLLKSEADRLEIEGINIDDSFKFKGLARNAESIKSLHGFKYFWVEEAQTISDASLKLLTPTLREADSEVWFTGNPRSSADPFSQRFIVPFLSQLLTSGYYEDNMHLIIMINWRDNPWFPAELEQERQWDFDNLPRALYDHIWEGRFNDQVENSIILPEWFDAAIDAHIKLGFKPTGVKVVSFDPSDEGRDPKGLAYRHGSVFLDIRESRFGDVNDGCDWATDFAINNRANQFTWDCDGLGVTLKRQVAQSLEGKGIDFQMFKGSESVDFPEAVYQGDDKGLTQEQRRTNEDTFRNKRAQYYWSLRDRFYAVYRAVVKRDYIDPQEMISLSSKIENLQAVKAEVCRIPRKPSGNGFIQILSKQEMLKLGIASPNMSDSMMMNMRVMPAKKWDKINYPKANIA